MMTHQADAREIQILLDLGDQSASASWPYQVHYKSVAISWAVLITPLGNQQPCCLLRSCMGFISLPCSQPPSKPLSKPITSFQGLITLVAVKRMAWFWVASLSLDAPDTDYLLHLIAKLEAVKMTPRPQPIAEQDHRTLQQFLLPCTKARLF